MATPFQLASEFVEYALGERGRTFGRDNLDVAESLNSLGAVKIAQGAHREAGTMLCKSLDIHCLRDSGGCDHYLGESVEEGIMPDRIAEVIGVSRRRVCLGLRWITVSVFVTTGVLSCSARQQHITQPPSSETGDPLAAAVLKVDEEFQRAKLANDLSTLRRILNDDYVGTNQNGNTRNKQQFLELWATFPISSLTTDRATVSFNEDHMVATITGDQTEVNATGTDVMQFQRVYVRTPTGEWRLRSAIQSRR